MNSELLQFCIPGPSITKQLWSLNLHTSNLSGLCFNFPIRQCFLIIATILLFSTQLLSWQSSRPSRNIVCVYITSLDTNKLTWEPLCELAADNIKIPGHKVIKGQRPPSLSHVSAQEGVGVWGLAHIVQCTIILTYLAEWLCIIEKHLPTAASELRLPIFSKATTVENSLNNAHQGL